jgi:hypothetical protein
MKFGRSGNSVSCAVARHISHIAGDRLVDLARHLGSVRLALAAATDATDQ